MFEQVVSILRLQEMLPPDLPNLKNIFAVLKNQNVCVNLRLLHRLTMQLCSQLKVRLSVSLLGVRAAFLGTV